MRLICESINDIDGKLKLFNLEKERISKNKPNIRLDEINKEISTLEATKRQYMDILSQMDGIEYRLYSYLLRGFNVTKAIDKVAEENYLNDIKPATKQGILPYYKNMRKICKLD